MPRSPGILRTQTRQFLQSPRFRRFSASMSVPKYSGARLKAAPKKFRRLALRGSLVCRSRSRLWEHPKRVRNCLGCWPPNYRFRKAQAQSIAIRRFWKLDRRI